MQEGYIKDYCPKKILLLRINAEENFINVKNYSLLIPREHAKYANIEEWHAKRIYQGLLLKENFAVED